MTGATQISKLPRALDRSSGLWSVLAGRRPAVFLDYDGTLTPIVKRPEDARISEGMRSAVRALAERCPVCVVSGRDRPVLQELMGVTDLVVAASHGFDIWSPSGGPVARDEGAQYQGLIAQVDAELRPAVSLLPGAHLERKRASVAVHHRLVADADRSAVSRLVDDVLGRHPGALKVTPGKMVYEIQPNIEWDKGRAVLHLLSALDLDGDDVVPLYLGDDLTDEHAFEAIRSRGVGVLVGSDDDPELQGRSSHARYRLTDVAEVELFLAALAGKIAAGRAVGGP